MTNPRMQRLFPIAYGVPFLVAAGLSVLMLVTDKNLRTDFGTLSGGYYWHWYVVLATAVGDGVGAGLLLFLRSRRFVLLGTIGSGLAIAVLLGSIATYHQVGFATAGDMADYLFGITYYGGYLRYLYDALLATYLVAFSTGLAGLAIMRNASAPSALKTTNDSAPASPSSPPGS